MVIPVNNICTIAKQQLSLLVFIQDPDRPTSENNWDEEEQM